MYISICFIKFVSLLICICTVMNLSSPSNLRRELAEPTNKDLKANEILHQDPSQLFIPDDYKGFLKRDFTAKPLNHSLKQEDHEAASNRFLQNYMNQNDFQKLSGQHAFNQCPTSLPSFPRFPHPNKVDNSSISLGLSSSRITRTNPITRRTRHFVPNDRKDEYYWQKRRKNNEAARNYLSRHLKQNIKGSILYKALDIRQERSREKRRTIDSVLEEQVLILSHENKLLRDELRTLKLKYGELPTDSNHNHVEITGEVEKVPINRTNEQVNPSPLNLCNEGLNGSNTLNKIRSSLNNNLSSQPTAISLPRLNVILENDRSDPNSSAKLVLSNLASGTLILSPVGPANEPRALHNDVLPKHGATSNGSHMSLTCAAEKAKTMEAAQALATLLHSSQDSPMRLSNGASHPEAAGTSRNSSIDDEVVLSSPIEGKQMQNLPHKLRFKALKRDNSIS